MESPADKPRSKKILILTGMSITLSTIIFFFAANASRFSFHFAPPVSILTIIYHSAILILSRRHRNSPNASPYPTMYPSIGLAAFLFILWMITIGFMIVAFNYDPQWWTLEQLIKLGAQFILAVMETGCLLSLVVLCARARKSLDAAEREGRIQI